ncbi:hypothetical protein [Pseudonocardia charpentierae]|uniref:Uncharacterized protein n=1 Tax=Pseudonocardia charpentierae TaxID=3075545 RepID=A0ABU2NKZ9_9PSEU|nr:hypothetical protein [Pseudonocardia sp. DSM 45834]MDT0353693.1 hypothetical protein [Pseudonocardia sp. DSM 45834]
MTDGSTPLGGHREQQTSALDHWQASSTCYWQVVADHELIEAIRADRIGHRDHDPVARLLATWRREVCSRP